MSTQFQSTAKHIQTPQSEQEGILQDNPRPYYSYIDLSITRFQKNFLPDDNLIDIGDLPTYRNNIYIYINIYIFDQSVD